MRPKMSVFKVLRSAAYNHLALMTYLKYRGKQPGLRSDCSYRDVCCLSKWLLKHFSRPQLLRLILFLHHKMYSKTCLKRPLQKKKTLGFQDHFSLNAGQKYCRMLKESILQYFRPSLSYNLSSRPLFCLFLSGRLRQVLLYVQLWRFR